MKILTANQRITNLFVLNIIIFSDISDASRDCHAHCNSDFAEDKLIVKGPVERYALIRHDND
jgi:hypothetical protein